MKKIILLSSFLFAFTGFQFANAQGKRNIDSQPNWGPEGHDYVEYYYLPDIETYYSVPKHKYVHMNPAGKWVYSNGLPHAHRDYDIYRGYKVVVNERDAFKKHKEHKVKYKMYKANHSQGNIKNSKDPKYKVHYMKTKKSKSRGPGKNH